MNLPWTSGDSNVDMFVYGLAALAIAGIGYAIWWNMKYKTVRSMPMTDHGIVDNMNYTASSTHYNYTTKMYTTDPEKNMVYLKLNKTGKHEFNSSVLYQRVRIDDHVKAEYVEVWRVERENPQHRVLKGYEIKSVTSPTGRTVTFN